MTVEAMAGEQGKASTVTCVWDLLPLCQVGLTDWISALMGEGEGLSKNAGRAHKVILSSCGIDAIRLATTCGIALWFLGQIL